MKKIIEIRWDYYDETAWQFYKTCKKLHYAASYGNYKAQLILKDFYQMYLMGGEL